MSKPTPPVRLRFLTVDGHPRGQPHLSAASGLVCAHGRVYVIADDEHHLAVFRDRQLPGRLHRVRAGDLPRDARERKRRKPDLETLFRLPPSTNHAGGRLVALGSGSRANRQWGYVIGLDARSGFVGGVRRFDLRPLYGPLRELLGGELNVEGAIVTEDAFLLLNRAVKEKSPNAVAHYRSRDLRRAMKGTHARIEPIAVRQYDLGAIDGIALGFTDAAALPGGGWAFTAVAEDTDDSYADGNCKGSVVGIVDADGVVRAMHRIARTVKIEGIDVQPTDEGLLLCLVTDADTPAQASELLLARVE